MRLLSSFLISVFVFSAVLPMVSAKQIPVNGICCQLKVQGYDESGEDDEGLRFSGTEENCYAEVAFTEDSPDADDHQSAYHRYLDQKIFAPAIRSVSKYQDSEDFQEYLQEFEGECSSENPSPQCLSERALCSYEKYGKVLYEFSGQAAVQQSLENQNTQDLLKQLSARDTELLEEMRAAEQALEMSLDVYRQFFESYRLHLSFKEVITSLVRVKNMTAFFRQLVSCVPNKFVGISTTKCN